MPKRERSLDELELWRDIDPEAIDFIPDAQESAGWVAFNALKDGQRLDQIAVMVFDTAQSTTARLASRLPAQPVAGTHAATMCLPRDLACELLTELALHEQATRLAEPPETGTVWMMVFSGQRQLAMQLPIPSPAECSVAEVRDMIYRSRAERTRAKRAH